MSAVSIITVQAARAVYEARLADTIRPDRWWLVRRRPILRFA
jgi:hypothetical protein